VSSPRTEATPTNQGGGRLQRRDKKRLAAAVVLALALAWLIAFIASNSEHVKVSFVFGDVSLSLVWVMLICAALGALVAVALPRVLRRRRQRSS
jgi:uncharacterized integral membrane protein